MPSYHDLVVRCGEKEYKITDSFSYVLTCTRVGGWCFWHKWNGQSELLGGEHEKEPFSVWVGDRVIVDNADRTKRGE